MCPFKVLMEKLGRLNYMLTSLTIRSHLIKLVWKQPEELILEYFYLFNLSNLYSCPFPWVTLGGNKHQRNEKTGIQETTQITNTTKKCVPAHTWRPRPNYSTRFLGFCERLAAVCGHLNFWRENVGPMACLLSPTSLHSGTWSLPVLATLDWMARNNWGEMFTQEAQS